MSICITGESHPHSWWGCAFSVSISIPGEAYHHSRWGCASLVRHTAPGMHILTGNYIIYTAWARGAEVVDFADVLIETWKLCFPCCRTKQDNFSYNWDIYSNKSLCKIEFQFNGSFQRILHDITSVYCLYTLMKSRCHNYSINLYYWCKSYFITLMI